MAGVCRVCGCTEGNACVLDEHGDVVEVADETLGTLQDGWTVCSWVEPDLCSGCLQVQVPPLLYDSQGRPVRGTP